MTDEPERSEAADFADSLGAFAAFGVATGMVGLRELLRPEVTAVALAIVVAVTARVGARPAGLMAAVMSALSFDFFHTEPNLSLKVSDPSDIVVTLLLLALGLDLGRSTPADRHARRRPGHRGEPA